MNQTQTLPEGWRWVKLGDVCHVQLGKMLSPISKTGRSSFPYLRNANVQWGRIDLGDVSEMDFNEPERQKFALEPGDLLVCEGGEPGRAAVWLGEIRPCYYQKALHRLRPINNQVDPYFLMYRLWLSALSGEFESEQAQSTIAHLPAVRLVTLPLLLPPLAEQQRIATVISDQMQAVGKARAAAREQLKAIESLPAAFIRAALSPDAESLT